MPTTLAIIAWRFTIRRAQNDLSKTRRPNFDDLKMQPSRSGAQPRLVVSRTSTASGPCWSAYLLEAESPIQKGWSMPLAGIVGCDCRGGQAVRSRWLLHRALPKSSTAPLVVLKNRMLKLESSLAQPVSDSLVVLSWSVSCVVVDRTLKNIFEASSCHRLLKQNT
jgi:hypothetical protein